MTEHLLFKTFSEIHRLRSIQETETEELHSISMIRRDVCLPGVQSSQQDGGTELVASRSCHLVPSPSHLLLYLCDDHVQSKCPRQHVTDVGCASIIESSCGMQLHGPGCLSCRMLCLVVLLTDEVPAGQHHILLLYLENLNSEQFHERGRSLLMLTSLLRELASQELKKIRQSSAPRFHEHRDLRLATLLLYGSSR